MVTDGHVDKLIYLGALLLGKALDVPDLLQEFLVHDGIVAT